MAYALKVIGKKQYQDMRLLGQIRNRFAHSHLELSFETLEIDALCKQLSDADATCPDEGYYADSPRSVFAYSVSRCAPPRPAGYPRP